MMRVLAVIAACRRTVDAGGDADASGSVGKEGEEGAGGGDDGDDLPDGFLEVRTGVCSITEKMVVILCSLTFFICA